VRVGLEDNIYLNKGELADEQHRAGRARRAHPARARREPMTAAEARAELSQVGGWSR
jgi:uncharacterized protein (DUF849 family)